MRPNTRRPRTTRVLSENSLSFVAEPQYRATAPVVAAATFIGSSRGGPCTSDSRRSGPSGGSVTQAGSQAVCKCFKEMHQSEPDRDDAPDGKGLDSLQVAQNLTRMHMVKEQMHKTP